ncbi:MAG: transposase [Bacteroidales bacterium]|jgi:transposase-like protein|nr:transposase [Bacteroidales bacterium]
MKKAKTKKYSDSFKREVVLEVLSGSITKEEARLRYNIGGRSTILDWMRVYAGVKMKTTGVDPVPILKDMGNSNDKSELEKKVKDLEAKLEYAELKGRAYQIMVEIAKEKYGLDLEKKHGAKQSKNSKKSGQK